MTTREMPENPTICPVCLNLDAESAEIRGHNQARENCPECHGVGYVEAQATPDGKAHGFRGRPAGRKERIAAAIAEGSVALEPEPHQDYTGRNAVVIQVPVMTAGVGGTDEKE